MWENIGLIVAIAAFLLNFIGTLIGCVWQLSRVESRLELSFQSAITKAKEETEAHVDAQTLRFGETVAALKEKMNLEITALRKEMTDEQKYTRDTFVRRDSFYEVQKSLESSIRSLGAELKLDLRRMEDKIDNKA